MLETNTLAYCEGASIITEARVGIITTKIRNSHRPCLLNATTLGQKSVRRVTIDPHLPGLFYGQMWAYLGWGP